jgi:hypothetical protein
MGGLWVPLSVPPPRPAVAFGPFSVLIATLFPNSFEALRLSMPTIDCSEIRRVGAVSAVVSSRSSDE